MCAQVQKLCIEMVLTSGPAMQNTLATAQIISSDLYTHAFRTYGTIASHRCLDLQQFLLDNATSNGSLVRPSMACSSILHHHSLFITQVMPKKRECACHLAGLQHDELFLVQQPAMQGLLSDRGDEAAGADCHAATTCDLNHNRIRLLLWCCGFCAGCRSDLLHVLSCRASLGLLGRPVVFSCRHRALVASSGDEAACALSQALPVKVFSPITASGCLAPALLAPALVALLGTGT